MSYDGDGWLPPTAGGRKRARVSGRQLPRRFSAKVVGLSFHAEYPDNLHGLHHLWITGAGPELVLVREPDNAYDANAVAVVCDGAVVGHLPASMAARMAPELDRGETWVVFSWEVLYASGKENQPGLSITLARRGGNPG